MRVYGPINSGAAVGGDGVATSNATSDAAITGIVLGFYVRYNDSPPAGTTDVTIATASGVMPDRTLLTLTNAATDGFFPIKRLVVTPAGANTTAEYQNDPLYNDKIKVTIAQANAADSVDVWVVYK